jgi:hypothetical protein
MKEGIVGGEAFAVDASIIVADAHRRRGVAKIEDLDPTSNRAVAEYLSVLDDAAFGGATLVEPKTISPTDPAARYTASASSLAGYAYSDNYLIDLKHAVIMDVEATTTIRQAEVGAAKTMLDRTAEQFGVTPATRPSQLSRSPHPRPGATRVTMPPRHLAGSFAVQVLARVSQFAPTGVSRVEEGSTRQTPDATCCKF